MDLITRSDKWLNIGGIELTDKGHKNIQGKDYQAEALTRQIRLNNAKIRGMKEQINRLEMRNRYYEVLAMTETECENYYATRKTDRQTS